MHNIIFDRVLHPLRCVQHLDHFFNSLVILDVHVNYFYLGFNWFHLNFRTDRRVFIILAQFEALEVVHQVVFALTPYFMFLTVWLLFPLDSRSL